MSRRRLRWHLSAAFAVAAMMLLCGAAPAYAHEARDVGAYHFLVGWGNEPAYSGQENSVQLVLTYLRTGKPVVNLGTTLKVTVVFGSQSMVFGLEPTFDPDTGLGTPGDYRAWLFPTAPGDYTFHFSGTIGSQKIDQSFTSSPTTFNPVQDPTAVEFPVQTPTMTELAQRVDCVAATPGQLVAGVARAALRHHRHGGRRARPGGSRRCPSHQKVVGRASASWLR